jgi:acetate kinase
MGKDIFVSILVLNAGSSTLKFVVFDEDLKTEVRHGTLDWSREPDRAKAIEEAVAAHGKSEVTIVGHRVVHGGTKFTGCIPVDDAVKAQIKKLAELAPLHNPQALEGIEAAEKALPNAKQFADFDTAFYTTLEPEAYIYPLPYEWYTELNVRRFGFHGISHQYCTHRAAELLGRDVRELRVISCHLGNGASATAVKGGKAIATTMGFTPMEGLMMGTRPGSFDAGILLYLRRHRGMSTDQLDEALNFKSGLLGVSGIGSDLRQIESAANAGNERAKLAIDIFCRSVRSAIGSLATTMGGLDVLIFTAGIGEHSAMVRSCSSAGLKFMGIEVDAKLNESAKPDCNIAASGSGIAILVLETREEFMIARSAKQKARGTVPLRGQSP